MASKSAPKSAKGKNQVKGTVRQKKAIKNAVENGGNVSKAMRDAGYSAKTAKTPKKLTESRAWEDLMEEYLPDVALAQVHAKLLSSQQIDHMVFPLAIKDEEINELLGSVGCVVRKIMHGETAIHCWFWAPNTMAQSKAVELAYKLKGRLTNKLEIKRPVADVLDELEEDVYGDLGRQAEKQMVATDPPVQNQD